MQEWDENYWETYIPVVNMITVRLLLALCNFHKLESKSIAFVLAFPQADLEVDIWMELTIGFIINEVEYSHSRSYVLKLNKSLYKLKQASLNWYEKLQEGLIARYFFPSVIEPCFYLKYVMTILTYVDDYIISGTCMKEIDFFIFSMQHGSENFILTDEEDVIFFLGIEITQNK